MHVTDKIVDKDGTHILSSTLEADGPFQLASKDATLDAKVIALRRTDSGGVFMQTAVTITEPAPTTAPAPQTDDDKALAYLTEKGVADPKAALAKFGAARVLAKMEEDAKAVHAALDADLDSLLDKKPAPTPAPTPAPPKDPTVQ